MQGPYFPQRLESPEDIKKLQLVVDVDKELNYVFSAIKLTRHSLEGKVPLIGFTGAPVCVCVREGGGYSLTSSAWRVSNNCLVRGVGHIRSL